MQRLPGLDVLRFYAALSVVLFHTVPESAHIPGVLSGFEAVTVFFVLSGFLITALLLREREGTGTICLTTFYLRRSLRIVPLYITVLLAVYALVPITPSQWTTFALFALIPNTLPIAALPVPLVALWSIGAEEQFYILFPRLLKRFSLANIVVGVIAGRWLLVILARATGNTALELFNELNRFDAMAVGALTAGWLHINSGIIALVRQYRAVPLALFMVAAVDGAARDTAPEYNFALAWVTAAMIVVIIRWRWLDNAVMRYGGALSFGVYLWHMPVFDVVKRADVPALAVVAWTIVLSLVLAAFTYRVVELPALRLRNRLQVLHE